MVPIDVS